MIDTTPKHVFKEKIIDACIKKQQSLIDDFNERIREILDAQGLGNKEKYDNNDVSQRGQAVAEITTLNDALSLANDEMSILQHLKSVKNDGYEIVGPGAIVVTDKAVFFVSVSIEELRADGKTLFGISTKSPLYMAMKGLSEESLFQHNEVTYKIFGIF